MTTNSVNIHTPSIQMLSPNTIPHLKESTLLAWRNAKSGNTHAELGMSHPDIEVIKDY